MGLASVIAAALALSACGKRPDRLEPAPPDDPAAASVPADESTFPRSYPKIP